MHVRSANPGIRILVLLGAVSLGGCKYIKNVQVPRSDNVAPACFATLYQNGNHTVVNGREFVSSIPSKVYPAVATAIDSGGVRKMTMGRTAFASYIKQGNLGVFQNYTLAPKVMTQSGSVGKTVKNGLFTFEFVRPSDWSSSGIGTLVQSGFTYAVSGEDFHGNKRTGDAVRFIYRP